MGDTVYDTGKPLREGVHLYAHSRRDGKEGICYLFINNSRRQTVSLQIPKCECYLLDAPSLRSQEIRLNGKTLQIADDATLPALDGRPCSEGILEIAPCTIAFFVTGEPH